MLMLSWQWILMAQNWFTLTQFNVELPPVIHKAPTKAYAYLHGLYVSTCSSSESWLNGK